MTIARRPIAVLGAVAALGLALTGCVAKSDVSAAGRLTVSSTADACSVSAATATSGTLAFDVNNKGDEVTEFYLLAEDGVRIVGEVENVAPGASRTLTVVAQPGKYFTVCKPGMLGAGVGRTAFAVSGEKVAETGGDAAQKQKALTQYASYVKDQVDQLLPAAKTFADAYRGGEDAAAKAQFSTVRAYYERIEPIAEQLGTLDPRLDFRELDAKAEGIDWTGFHRIEKDLWAPAAGAMNSDGTTPANLDWAPSTPAERATFADKLLADLQELYDHVHSDAFVKDLESKGIAGISNGSISLLDEVANGKITGEEDWWSGTDLSDFAANVEGSKMAFSVVREFAESKGAEGKKLVEQIDRGFSALEAELAVHGSLKDGFASYSTVTETQKRDLTDLLNALAEPLSKLTSTILG
ncbi:iron uptake system protein EfeO [Microbacterium azadirachtae]|uniref:Efem/EfeO family lipoprotein n=1 Tax=Microbacterium azadirachtae TaxID=582680 RepID=A0A0F0LCG3_9MICO|nr:iron uptake system protein EfeO [Microbacterium azadirachtae]KJL30833.1 Efem/EfeO family lipoprotein precursor [Microbacterium azadirachtae]